MAMLNRRNVTLAIISLLILVVLALLIGNFTYSYVAPDLSDDVSSKGEVTATGDTLIFSSGNKLELTASTDNFNATSGNLSDTTNPSVRLIASSKTNNASASYYAGIKISENTYTYSTADQNAEVLLLVRDETGGIISTSADGKLTYKTVTDSKGSEVSGFDITGKTGTFNIAANHAINTTSSTSGTTHTWEFTLIFVNYTYDQSINENASIAMDVVLQRDELLTNLADYIVGLYTSDGENCLYYHDGVGTYTNADQEAGDNSYRFAGANPNNFVCFGSDEETCSNDNLYRIIGVFNGQVKLIKYDYAGSDLLGTDGDFYNASYAGTDGESSYYKGSKDQSIIPVYYWNYSNGNSSTNDWSTSRLNTVNLNTNYINAIGSKWSNLIATSTWQVGGNAWENIGTVLAKTAYTNEIVSPSAAITYNAKIGLMYISDYGYAASPESWTINMNTYDNSTATSNNWMYMGLYEWTISRNSSSTGSTVRVFNTGSVDYYGVYGNFGVRPVFYLNENVEFSSGSGTQTDPYRLVAK